MGVRIAIPAGLEPVVAPIHVPIAAVFPYVERDAQVVRLHSVEAERIIMSGLRILGIVVLVVGIVLLIMGYNATQAPAEEIRETLTGRFTEQTTWMLIGGVAGVVGGLLLAMFGGSNRPSGSA
jgi:hypothetical protein